MGWKLEEIQFAKNVKRKKKGRTRHRCGSLHNIPLHHFQSPDQTNVTSDTETPNINTQGHLEKIKRAGTGRGPIKKKKMQPFIFTSVQRREVVMVFTSVFFMSNKMPPTFTSPSPLHPPASLLVFHGYGYLGLVFDEKVEGFCACVCFSPENEHWLPSSTREGSHY